MAMLTQRGHFSKKCRMSKNVEKLTAEVGYLSSKNRLRYYKMDFLATLWSPKWAFSQKSQHPKVHIRLFEEFLPTVHKYCVFGWMQNFSHRIQWICQTAVEKILDNGLVCTIKCDGPDPSEKFQYFIRYARDQLWRVLWLCLSFSCRDMIQSWLVVINTQVSPHIVTNPMPCKKTIFSASSTICLQI